MFTGIIEGMGRIARLRPAGDGMRLEIEAPFDLADCRIGDSIAVNGSCLTVTEKKGRIFSVDVSPETINRTTLKSAALGDPVNLERALKLGDRLDGHLVSGHVDGTGLILDKRRLKDYILVLVSADRKLLRYMIEKGSVAIDGVSLTINRVHEKSLEVLIIPHTASLTTIGIKKAADPVNIEVDMIAKYVERFVKPPEKPGGIDTAFLIEKGFL